MTKPNKLKTRKRSDNDYDPNRRPMKGRKRTVRKDEEQREAKRRRKAQMTQRKVTRGKMHADLTEGGVPRRKAGSKLGLKNRLTNRKASEDLRKAGVV